MDDFESQKQIDQMVKFILNEAKDKASEIEAKSMEDFNIEKLKLLQQMKDKVRQDYKKKAKQLETEKAIARSTAINKARLKKIAARQMKIQEAVKSAQRSLTDLSKDSHKYPKLLTDLIVQAMLRLLENEVMVVCRKEDEVLIQDCMAQAEKKYKQIVQEAGVQAACKSHLNTKRYLPAGNATVEGAKTCSGGVILTSMDGKIVCDNTLDARLDLVVQECLPQLRKILYDSD
eukprot:Protomagalhaensia_sp_Gyna_25__209@NODE_109_length_5208_cov_543_113755_g86_i0_p4_GENE_NODE_109_length_5208_cov_543_113755_g86_i0NODE_109_length_5208_cov_543_113755_g86_i0_p4_ORF_typecomplete_len232_score60_34vATPsynt_E/PF01991_18/5e59DUF885/PF05960_11/0_013Par3_HAL_N_term/PF12053_8/5e03Par3_HAL_N_term/PF12053_8/0_27DUF4886/PF16227_5/0_024DUF4886/PF16227_5/1_3e03ATPsynt_B/PF00430_18/59ATPsynt_B/PF00430_18/0_39DUF4570/PF15134_6/0_22DUF4570/PF15134_6/7_2e02DUF1104/PF06518_11/1_5DUF1104/PF06518_11/5_